MNSIRNILAAFLLLSLSAITSCVKDDFDQPPANGVDPDVTVTTTIGTLKNWYDINVPKAITEDWVISGIVTADDKSGNFYKTLVIQDATAGIAIRIDRSDMYTTMPIGRRVFIKLKGLYVANYNNLIQIGYGIDPMDPTSVTAIPSSVVDEFILRGQWGLSVQPVEVTIGELNSTASGNTLHWPYQNMLIKILDVEFDASHAGETYADAVGLQTENKTLNDCNGQFILLRNSGYASFASDTMPLGNGTFTGIASVFGTDLQLYIRNTNDVQFENARCGQQPVNSDSLDYLMQDFETCSNNQDVALSGWQNLIVDGTRAWQGKEFSGNTYVQATAYQSGGTMETWLITPKLNFDIADTLEFQSAVAYWTHNGLQVFYTTNYDGSNFPAATWVPVSCALAGQGDANYDWVNSGTIDLSSLSGTGFIAFRYTGDGTLNTATYAIDNVTVH